MKFKNYTYYYDRGNGLIVLEPALKKVKNGIKVYFSRNLDAGEKSDLPVVYADTPKGKILSWNFPEFEIIRVDIKRPILFGLLGYEWEVASPRKIK